MKYIKLKDVCKINMGQSPDSSSYNESGEGIPFFQGNADFGDRYPVTRIWCSEPKKVAQENDILISVRAPIGAINYSKEKCCIGRGLAALTVDKTKISEKLLFWVLKAKKEELNRQGTGSTFKAISKKSLEELLIPQIDIKEQEKDVEILEKIYMIIQNKHKELKLLTDLISARFVEMFGDPITNSKLLPIEKIEERYFLKAGITTKAEDIHDYLKDKYEIPCYGGNGIRGYVENLSYEGCYPIIGRQGALCGNVQYATGKFHATEHAVLVSTLKNDNTMWVYYMLKLMDLYRYHTGAAQPGLAVKKLNTIDVIVADINLQNQFAAFVHQINKSKFVIHKFLYCTTHNTKSIIKPRPNTKESGKIRGRETTCRRILTF